jgi:prepilin-type N-terminal cleavage/methylation domain-containing protein
VGNGRCKAVIGLRDHQGLSLLEVLVALTLVAIATFGSLYIIRGASNTQVPIEGGSFTLTTRLLAQIGRTRTQFADRPARAKTVASQWVQAEVEYLRSLGFLALQRRVLDPASYGYQGSGGLTFRDISSASNPEPGEMALPPGFGAARVILEVEDVLEVEGVEPLNRQYLIGRIRIRVGLYRDASELPESPGDLSGAFVASATSVHRP